MIADDKDVSLTSDEEDEKSPLLMKLERKSVSPSSSRSTSPEPTTDPRFNQPKPSGCKRLALIVFLAILFWAAFSLRGNLLGAKKKPQIIYANRYSKEHKFRPAASPIITETLKDGRIRLRGALPDPTPEPTQSAKPKKRKPQAGKLSGKRKPSKKKSSPSAKRK